MKKFWNQILIGICTCALLLAGCAQEDAEQMQMQTEIETDPSQFVETFNDRLSIDAPVYPFADAQPKVYHATSELFTQEQIDAFLVACGDSLTSMEENGNEYWVEYVGSTGKEGIISLRESVTDLYPSQLYYEKNDNWWQNYTVYPRQQYYDEYPTFCYADMFAEPREFSFSTVEDAEAEVRDALAQLGLTDLYLNRTLYVHKEGMEELTEITKEYNATIALKPVPTKDDWTDEDEGYLFEFFQTLDGAPITHLIIGTDALNYNGAYIIVNYQKSGITCVSVDYYLNADECVETPSSIISASEALEYAKQKLGSVLTRQDASITKVSGEYMYVRENGEFLLRPVWVIYSKYAETVLPDFVKWDYIFIDAITGEEI